MEGQSKKIKFDKSSLQNQIVSWAFDQMTLDEKRIFTKNCINKLYEHYSSKLKEFYDKLETLKYKVCLIRQDHKFDSLSIHTKYNNITIRVKLTHKNAKTKINILLYDDQDEHITDAYNFNHKEFINGLKTYIEDNNVDEIKEEKEKEDILNILTIINTFGLENKWW